MRMVAHFAKKLFGRFGGWIGVRLVQEVPEDIGACEFDCSKEECEGPDLRNCERRIRSEAAEHHAREGNVPPAQPDKASVPAT
jgi:hypothetical protein